MKTYLCLVLDLPSERLCIKGYRTVLGKFAKVAYTADLIAIIAQHKDNLEMSAAKAHTYMCECVSSVEGISESVTQIQKYFSKGRPKRGGGLVFTNILLVHNEEIKEIIRDIKHILERHKIRIGVQCMQYPEVVKIRCILFLMPKIEIIEWTEFLIRLLKEMLSSKVIFALVVLKINDSIIFKNNNKRQGSITVKAWIDDNMAVHAEIIKN